VLLNLGIAAIGGSLFACLGTVAAAVMVAGAPSHKSHSACLCFGRKHAEWDLCSACLRPKHKHSTDRPFLCLINARAWHRC
jgi:hypothetical protein